MVQQIMREPSSAATEEEKTGEYHLLGYDAV
jgi:hypothetical protein